MANPAPDPTIDRSILVFAIWSVLGLLGLAIVLEGLNRDVWLLAASGVAVLVAAFVAHIVVNAIFHTGFSRGETALGIAAYGVLGLVFIAGWLSGGLSLLNFYSGLTFFGVIAAGFIAYLSTRHGLRGAFSQFHIKPGSSQGASR